MKTGNEVPLDILILLDAVRDQDVVDDADTDFWNCLAYSFYMDNFDLKKKSFQELYPA